MDEPGSSTVFYWSKNSGHKKKAKGKHQTYKFYNYTSGYIHHCTIRNLEVSWRASTMNQFSSRIQWDMTASCLQHNTKYYYVVGVGQTARKFWFVTPPEVGPDVPYTFGLIGKQAIAFDCSIYIVVSFLLSACYRSATHLQGTWGRASIRTRRWHITRGTHIKAKQSCSSGTCLMLITTLTMTTLDGIPGEGLLRGVRRISLGYGLLAITRSTLFLRL